MAVSSSRFSFPLLIPFRLPSPPSCCLLGVDALHRSLLLDRSVLDVSRFGLVYLGARDWVVGVPLMFALNVDMDMGEAVICCGLEDDAQVFLCPIN